MRNRSQHKCWPSIPSISNRSDTLETVRCSQNKGKAKEMSPAHLPQPATAFIGRNCELEQIATLLTDPACRLLTLVGPGGIGKTRLALQVATNQQLHFVDGVSFIALTSSD